MKVLYSTRLFSGLESSFINGIWKPTGVPTIYRVIETLDNKYDMKFIFSAKDNGNGHFSSWHCKKDLEFSIVGLKHPIKILSGVNIFPPWLPRKVLMIFRDIRQLIKVIIEIIKFKPDVIYCDHANTLVAAVMARYQRNIPVVFRVMGVYPFMRSALSSTKIIHKIYRWAYSSPFALVICTQDGSGVEPWLDNAINNNTKIEVLLNGVDEITLPDILDDRLKLVSKKKDIIIFVGKLERYKGCYEFVESVLLILEKEMDKAHALIIGTGSEERQLKKLVENSGHLNCFTFIDRLPHEQIAAAHKISEIYVSMNHLGNLSNANLEAIQSDSCMVIPDPQPETGVDVVTSNLLGESVIKTPINNANKLSEVLNYLINHNGERVKLSQAVNVIKKDFLWSWNRRIELEVKLLENLVRINT